MKNEIKVLLADDHAIVLEGIRTVLNLEERITVVAEAYNGLQVLEYLQTTPVDIAVLDINMPEMDGLTCARIIKQKYPDVKIIILTMYSQKSFLEEIFRTGIDGCLLKNNTGAELVTAILRVIEGRSFFDHLQNFISEDKEIAQFRLSAREIEIIKMIATGLSNGQISNKLNISESTVKTHRKNIMRKTGTHNIPHLIQFAHSNQMI